MIKPIKKSLILFPMAVLKVKVIIGTLVICAEGTRLLQEDGTGETPQAL
jgi:hypothetical protein